MDVSVLPCGKMQI